MQLKYVVLYHYEVAAPHYDLMLERSAGGTLATWRLAQWPPVAGDMPVPIADHRPAYLDYQGPVSGGRGTVRQIAKGIYQCSGDIADQWHVRLDQLIDLVLPVRGDNEKD